MATACVTVYIQCSQNTELDRVYSTFAVYMPILDVRCCCMAHSVAVIRKDQVRYQKNDYVDWNIVHL